MNEIKKIPGKAGYDDVVNAGLILPYKEKYTIRDFKKLVADGWNQLEARWIIMCSCVYWRDYKNSEISKIFETSGFLRKCELSVAKGE